MAKSLCWCDLTAQTLEAISARPVDHHGDSSLAKALDLKHYKTDARERILLDLYVMTLAACKERKLTPEKTSTFFSIVKANHFKYAIHLLRFCLFAGKGEKTNGYRPPFHKLTITHTHASLC